MLKYMSAQMEVFITTVLVCSQAWASLLYFYIFGVLIRTTIYPKCEFIQEEVKWVKLFSISTDFLPAYTIILDNIEYLLEHTPTFTLTKRLGKLIFFMYNTVEISLHILLIVLVMCHYYSFWWKGNLSEQMILLDVILIELTL